MTAQRTMAPYCDGYPLNALGGAEGAVLDAKPPAGAWLARVLPVALEGTRGRASVSQTEHTIPGSNWFDARCSVCQCKRGGSKCKMRERVDKLQSLSSHATLDGGGRMWE
jgi:hypothetical protein